MIRATSFVAGALVLIATANVTIRYTGGYHTPHAILTLAVAVGVMAAACVIGKAWSSKRWVLAIWLLVAIVAGEASGFLSTAERLITQREAAQAPIRTAHEAFEKASNRVTEAERARALLPATAPRLEAALTAKTAADAAVVAQAAERACLANCRALLQSQVDAASREIDAARAELEKQTRTAETELQAARAVLAGIAPPLSATPLAERIGLPAWLIDVIAAGLAAFAANGLGVGLIAFAAHPAPAARKVETQARPGIPDAEHAAHFAVEVLKPAPEEATDLIAVFRAYASWCAARRVTPLSEGRLGAALATVFDRAGVPVFERNGQIVAKGIKVEGNRRLIGST